MIFLHGGRSRYFNNQNIAFWSEVVNSSIKNHLLFLNMELSQYKVESETLTKRLANHDITKSMIKAMLISGGTEKTLDFYLWSNFSRVSLSDFDIIYFGGGCEDTLNHNIIHLQILDQIRDADNNSIIIGDSAGTNMLSKYCFSNDRDGIFSGFGIRNVKTFCHYNSSKFRNLDKLVKFQPKLDTIPLHEYEYVVL